MYDSGTMEVRIYDCAWKRDDGPESHELLRRAVEAYLGERVPSLTVCRDGEYGKPYVEELPDIHFSITHSGGYWLCAVGRQEVGLDLQEVRDRETEKIARRFFHPSETEWLRLQDGDAFFKIWAAKESYVKYTGEGITKGLDYFSVIDGLPAYQQEVRFHDGYFLILTTETDVAVCLMELPDETAGSSQAAKAGRAARDEKPGGEK